MTKKILHALVLLLVVLSSCKKKEEATTTTTVTDWGIGTSNISEASNASGNITKQNDGPLVTYQTDSAFVRAEGNQYIFKLYFTSRDSLTCYLDKQTTDFNYHSDAATGANKLVMVLLNADTLQLNSSAISIQPKADIQRFHTVTNLHSSNKGDLNGTVDKVPLVQ